MSAGLRSWMALFGWGCAGAAQRSRASLLFSARSGLLCDRACGSVMALRARACVVVGGRPGRARAPRVNGAASWRRCRALLQVPVLAWSGSKSRAWERTRRHEVRPRAGPCGYSSVLTRSCFSAMVSVGDRLEFGPGPSTIVSLAGPVARRLSPRKESSRTPSRISQPALRAASATARDARAPLAPSSHGELPHVAAPPGA